jgi:predicted AAA+ superfamily ATPase
MKHNNSFNLSSGKVGAIAELAVAADLMRRGYEVYRAVSQASDFDLLAIKNGKILTIEVVSSVSFKKDGKLTFSRRRHVKSKKPDAYAIVNHQKEIIDYLPEL